MVNFSAHCYYFIKLLNGKVYNYVNSKSIYLTYDHSCCGIELWIQRIYAHFAFFSLSYPDFWRIPTLSLSLRYFFSFCRDHNTFPTQRGGGGVSGTVKCFYNIRLNGQCNNETRGEQGLSSIILVFYSPLVAWSIVNYCMKPYVWLSLFLYCLFQIIVIQINLICFFLFKVIKILKLKSYWRIEMTWCHDVMMTMSYGCILSLSHACRMSSFKQHGKTTRFLIHDSFIAFYIIPMKSIYTLLSIHFVWQ